MDAMDKLIWRTLNCKSGDNLPYTGMRSKATRLDFYRMFARLGFTCGAEVGVGGGRNAEALLKLMPGVRLLCVDPWAAYDRFPQEYCDRRHAEAVARLAPFPNCQIVRQPSLAAAQDIALGSLDFVYIDGDHRFDAVMTDLIEWARRVRVGGIISGHDYFHFCRAGVVEAVDAYTRAHDVKPWYITRELEPSFIWVKRA